MGREGRGFTLEELKAAKINVKDAQRLFGVAVDHRRQNKTTQTFTANVQRLKEYKAKHILIPRHTGVAKAGDASAEEVNSATQLTGSLMKYEAPAATLETRAITKE